MERIKEKITIEVDEHFRIVVDSDNWTVVHTKISSRGKNEGGITEVDESFSHNLEGALKSIMRLKALYYAESSSILDYLSWHRETLLSMTKAILEKEIVLREAMELNKARLATA